MNRQQILSILNTMSDDSLAEAMKAVGVDCGEGEEGYDLGEQEVEGLEPWNARDVSVPDSPKPPIFDKSKIVKQPEMGMMSKGRREYMPDDEDQGELSDYVLHTGM